jgi:hypothetical protein
MNNKKSIHFLFDVEVGVCLILVVFFVFPDHACLFPADLAYGFEFVFFGVALDGELEYPSDELL